MNTVNKVTEKLLKKLEESARNYGMWTVIIPERYLNETTCECSYFMKKAQCKNTLSMLICLKLLKALSAARRFPHDRKWKRGCPGKAKRPLMLQ
jgi:hypothetical protein